ncbi:hypothetical protein BVX97_03590 [bacterium E08(2017)]|nr:hypothetical protein BVX97_03590 [bacterium E08(2017)]
MYKKFAIWMMFAVMIAMAPTIIAEGKPCADGCEHHEHDEEDREITDAELMKFLKKNVPGQVKILEHLKKEGETEEHEEMLVWLKEALMQYYELKEDNPEMADTYLAIEKLGADVEVMVWEAHKNEDTDFDKLKPKVRAQLEKIFDLQVKARKMEVKVLEEEIKEIETMLEKRVKNKTKIIDRHLKEILDDRDHDDDLGWW